MKFRTSAIVVGVVVITLASIGGIAWQKNRSDPISDFMVEQYGEYDSRTKRWGDSPTPDRATAFAICARRAVSVKGQSHTMLAACAGTTSATAAADAVGQVDLHVLRDSGSAALLVASLQDAGKDDGNVFGTTVEVVRLGHDFYGFEVTSAFMARGDVLPGLTIFAPRESTLAPVLEMATGFDNTGTGACEKPIEGRCIRIERKVRIDDSDPALPVYPIEVVESGPAGKDGARATRKIVLRFNPTTRRFAGPKDFDLTLG